MKTKLYFQRSYAKDKAPVTGIPHLLSLPNWTIGKGWSFTAKCNEKEYGWCNAATFIGEKACKDQIYFFKPIEGRLLTVGEEVLSGDIVSTNQRYFMNEVLGLHYTEGEQHLGIKIFHPNKPIK